MSDILNTQTPGRKVNQMNTQLNTQMDTQVSTQVNKKTKSGHGLGRGLGSLLGDFESHRVAPTSLVKEKAPTLEIKPERLDKSRIFQLDLTQIQPNPQQPRKLFESDKLRELSASIKEQGVIQPIIVRETERGSFQIIAGERRWRAAQLAGLAEIPAILMETDDKKTLELALIENIQRADLGPLEEAEAYRNLANEYKMTQSEIALRVGKERATVANSIRLLELPNEIKEMLRAATLSVGHAKILLSLQNASEQISIAREIVTKKLSVRAAERLIASKLTPTPEASLNNSQKIGVQKIVDRIAEDLQKTLGTKVQIDYKEQHGRLILHFYSDEELNKLVEKLKSSTT